jgi:hypothetical protein
MEPLVEMSIKSRYESLIKTKACNLLFVEPVPVEDVDVYPNCNEHDTNAPCIDADGEMATDPDWCVQNGGCEDEQELTANCGGIPCTPTEKEDSWTDLDVVEDEDVDVDVGSGWRGPSARCRSPRPGCRSPGRRRWRRRPAAPPSATPASPGRATRARQAPPPPSP